MYILPVLLLNIPAVKYYVGSEVSNALSEKTGAEVSIGRIDLSMLKRIIIDDIAMKDLNGKEMLSAPRMSVKLNILDLINGKISISSAQLFGLKANLYKKSASEKPNFQFLIDAFASKDTTKKSPTNLEISSLIIRRSELSYNQLDDTDSIKLSPKHINIKDISAHIILNTLTNDSLNLNIKKISLNETHGLSIKKLALKLIAGKSGARLSDFTLQLPNSQIELPEAVCSYKLENGKILDNSLKFRSEPLKAVLLPDDIGAFTGQKHRFDEPITVLLETEGTDKEIKIKTFDLQHADNLTIKATAEAAKTETSWHWDARLRTLKTSSEGIERILKNIDKDASLPAIVSNLGSISMQGTASGANSDFETNSRLLTESGQVSLHTTKIGNKISGIISTEDLDLGKLTGNADMGVFKGNVSGETLLSEGKPADSKVIANIGSFIYKGNEYADAKLEAEYKQNKTVKLIASANDENGDIDIEALHNMAGTTSTNFKITAFGLNPGAIGITDKWQDSSFDFALQGNIQGKDFNNPQGELHLDNLIMHSNEGDYKLDNLDLIVKQKPGGMEGAKLTSDFGQIGIEGDFQYATLLNSLKNIISNRLPTLPGFENTAKTNNKINVSAVINNSEFAERLLGIPLELHEPAHLFAELDDSDKKIHINLSAKHFKYGGKTYQDGFIYVTSPDNKINATANLKMLSDKGETSRYTINSRAENDQIKSNIDFESHGRHTIKGNLNADARFFKDEKNRQTASIKVLPSEIITGDTIWDVSSSDIIYYKDHLEIGSFSIRHQDQHININGLAEKESDDEIRLNMKDVNVSYILDLVNFHSVEFAGLASGNVKMKDLFSDPTINASLNVKNFLFETGSLGTLAADAVWNLEDGNINIDALAKEDSTNHTVIKGFVSPKRKEINLDVTANGSNLEFLKNYCSSFASDINLRAHGRLNVVGPFKNIQLVGNAEASGSVRIKPLNTSYTLEKVAVKLIPDDMEFVNATIKDIYGHEGVVNGHLRHQHLGRWTYDLRIDMENLLALDLRTFGEDTFYGTAYATGFCTIKGKSGRVDIDVNATPQEGSKIVYNASSPDRINDGFIHWKDRNAPEKTASASSKDGKKEPENKISSDLFLNLLIHCTPDATLQVLMDERSGDYIALNGDGNITATYHDKGTFNMYGTYYVDHGTYRLTIQDVLKREFDFKPGGSISFGGDAFDANLNLQAQYTLNSVPLSDINIGQSFTNNNIRVDCIMNISGTPGRPFVDFSLDMPTVASDAKQMIMNVMNTHEEMNQQVLYLLAVGRFLNQENNSSSQSQRQSQTSLAMQSILSGTISQQLSTMLENVIDNKQWNLGANISTGDEGFNNAEYEGLVSGRLFNNRLLFNGQFGYRDNPNATSSFIGDFDLRYLLVPTGSTAIRVYNQTNNKYFTKNTLNTQGVGLIIKKDFGGWRDFFRWRKNKKASPRSLTTPPQ